MPKKPLPVFANGSIELFAEKIRGERDSYSEEAWFKLRVEYPEAFDDSGNVMPLCFLCDKITADVTDSDNKVVGLCKEHAARMSTFLTSVFSAKKMAKDNAAQYVEMRKDFEGLQKELRAMQSSHSHLHQRVVGMESKKPERGSCERCSYRGLAVDTAYDDEGDSYKLCANCTAESGYDR